MSVDKAFQNQVKSRLLLPNSWKSLSKVWKLSTGTDTDLNVNVGNTLIVSSNNIYHVHHLSLTS